MIHLDPSRRTEAIDAGLIACVELLMYAETYRRIVEEWNPVAVCDDNKVIGVLISKSNTIHLAIIPEYRGRWASRRIIREMLKYGTTTDDGDHRDFVERLGFKRIGSRYEYEDMPCHF